MAKGQATIELLLILAAFFAYLAVWASAIATVRSGASDSTEQKYAELALSDLVGAGNEAYLLGTGNSRELDVRLKGETEFSFDSDGRMANASILNGSKTLWKETRFNIADDSRSFTLNAGLNHVEVAVNEDKEVVFTSP